MKEGIRMNLRAPAVPLITVDPYFSVWSMADHLAGDTTRHWTGKPNTLLGTVSIDGQSYGFMGAQENLPALSQTQISITALKTTYIFRQDMVELTATFLSPQLPDQLEIMSQPVSYLEIQTRFLDGRPHHLSIQIEASEELCLNSKGQMPVTVAQRTVSPALEAIEMGSAEQPILAKKGDDIRIDWGYFYLAVRGGHTAQAAHDGMTFVQAEAPVSPGHPALFVFAYDDRESLLYFGHKAKAYWNRNGASIDDVIRRGIASYSELSRQCDQFDENLFRDAVHAGGEKYAQILQLAFRQVMAAHKLAVDENGEILYISKECFSNGCAATVDVSYPSIPMYLYYNPELIKGMLRPIFRYAESPAWQYPFAPHDVGTYPILNGQVYSKDSLDGQMPVEECGNMLLMVAATAIVTHDVSYAAAHWDTLSKWASYLKEHGVDPENQLCTDDFAGHLAHNCNLSLKAIMALVGMAALCEMKGDDTEAGEYMACANAMKERWIEMADNGDGTYRLAFDQPDTYSMKYNVVWDIVFGSHIFPAEVLASEFAGYKKRIHPYGMPLDNRKTYTKSDWLVWTATLAREKEEFEAFIEPLWRAYHNSPSRVPMTDWYDTVTSIQAGFQHRTVQGGLFMKVLEASGKCRYWD